MSDEGDSNAQYRYSSEPRVSPARIRIAMTYLVFQMRAKGDPGHRRWRRKARAMDLYR
jgi:hypothetical protein